MKIAKLFIVAACIVFSAVMVVGQSAQSSQAPTRQCKRKNLKVLVYGFGVYAGYSENITETIAKQFPRQKNVVTWVFPARYDRDQFVEVVRKYKPDVVIGLGMTGIKQKITIETRAYNEYQQELDTPHDSSYYMMSSIIPDAPAYFDLPAPREEDKRLQVSQDAGRIFCNFSMYVMQWTSLHPLKGAKSFLFTFFHVPGDYNIQEAIAFIQRQINLARGCH